MKTKYPDCKYNYHIIKIHNATVVSKYSELNKPYLYENSRESQVDENEVRIFFFDSVKNILKIGIPTILFYLCLHLQQTMSLSFVGRKYNNQDMINSIGIVDLYTNCLMLCFIIGLISGLDTLLGNALGSNNLYLFGLYIHRARLITYASGLVLTCVHYFFAMKVIGMFKIDGDTLAYCWKFLTWSIVYILCDIQFLINFRALAVLNKSNVCLVILLFSILLHPFWCWLFISHFDLNVSGAGASLALSQGLSMLISTLYIHFSKAIPEEAYFPINSDCFKGWWDYLSFTLPSAFMLCCDWMAYEILAVFAIFISKDDYSIHIFLTNIANLLSTLGQGLGIAATILIGENIAKGMIKQAKAIALYSFILSEMCVSVCIIFLIIFRNKVLMIFVDDSDLLSKANSKSVILILAIAQIFESTQSVMGNIYRGMGKQRHASIIAFFQYYFIQIFFTWLFAFQCSMGVTGIWLAILVGNLLTTGIFILFFFTRLNFEKVNVEVKEMLEKDQKLISKGDAGNINDTMGVNRISNNI